MPPSTHSAPLYCIHHPRHRQTHPVCAPNQQHCNFNNDKGLSTITGLSSRLFPLPKGINRLPFSSRLCLLVPTAHRPQHMNQKVCDTVVPVSRTPSKPANLPLQLWETLSAPRTRCKNSRACSSVGSRLSPTCAILPLCFVHCERVIS